MKIMVTINGEMQDVAGQTIEEYLLAHQYNTQRIAIERNGEIVPKSAYASVVLCENDSIEIVNFVGGG